jgi:methyltransferase (TIGR00027 family)
VENALRSFTAQMAAMMRAAHMILDGEPKIFMDPLALRLSGAESEDELLVTLNAFQRAVITHFGQELTQTLFKYLRAVTTMRSRYTEDELSWAIHRGVEQYVILGAGLDSFAHRREDLVDTVRVFEVDLRAPQQWKRARLRALNIVPPKNLTFIPFDFEKGTLTGALQTGGYVPDRPAFFSWLGTTHYLTVNAVFETLREIASLRAGSEIVFQYQVSEAFLDEQDRRLLDVLKAGGAKNSEPWLSFFEPTSLAERVTELGFTQISDFGPEEARTRYFDGRTDKLPVPHLSRLMKARVGDGVRRGGPQ